MSTVQDIDLHVRSYRSALKSTLEVTVNSLANSHIKMEPILHPYGANPRQLDVAAFVYSLLRLPSCIDKTHKVVIAQIPDIFTQAGFAHVEAWPRVTAPGRRRTMHYHNLHHILAMFAASISDVDDITNLLIAYQTEWNKFHTILRDHYSNYKVLRKNLATVDFCKYLNISSEDWNSLVVALGVNWRLRFKRIYQNRLNLRIQLLAGSWIDYTKATQKWWKNLSTAYLAAPFNTTQSHMSAQTIYFVSSNTHSLINLASGYILERKKHILDYIKQNDPELFKHWKTIESGESLLDPNDFLYFASRSYFKDLTHNLDYQNHLNNLGFTTVPASHYLDINTQLIPISALANSNIDPRLKISKPQRLKNSNVYILNIDYPLGFTAYHVLTETLANAYKVKGLYIMGKAAVLNGEIGDLQVPRLVFDEHTQNSYIFKNCFNTFFPFINNQGSILTNQKSVSVLGTFLENEALLETYSKNNLTVIEMESGPYLNAVTEATYDQQTPKNTIIDLNNAPFDIGIVNYTSDTPYSKAKNLGSKRLTLDGIEPTYLCSLAILQRIINLEEQS